MRSLITDRMPLTPWRDSIHRRVSSALTRMPDPLRAVTWQSQDFVGEAYAAGYLRQMGGVHYLTCKAVARWFEVNPRPDPDADRRRDLVPYNEVLREFGPEIADSEARPPVDKGRLAEQRLNTMFKRLGYRPDEGRAA